jgi:hypothetical protein
VPETHRSVANRPRFGAAAPPSIYRRWSARAVGPHADLGSDAAAPVRAARAWLTVMAIDRLPGLPRVVMSEVDGTDALYEIALTAAPSPAWRAVFLHPPTRLLAGSVSAAPRSISVPPDRNSTRGSGESTAGSPTRTRWWRRSDT